MKFLKKLTAVSAILAILLTNSISFAANSAINDATATASGLVAGTDTIIVTSASGAFTSTGEIVNATITKLDGTAITTTLTTTGDDSNVNTSTLNITSADLTDNTSYIITFTTDTGDYGTTTLRVGNPTNDTLTVTARVQPILKFGMEANSLDFGTLTTDFGAGVTTGIEVGTNAVNGLTVTATSTNGGLKSTTASHTINDSTDDALYDAEGYQFTSTLGAHDSTSEIGTTITGLDASSVDNSNLNTSNVKTIYSANKPQNFDTTDYDTDFTVQAKIAESTPSASDYTDVIVFTATANF